MDARNTPDTNIRPVSERWGKIGNSVGDLSKLHCIEDIKLLQKFGRRTANCGANARTDHLLQTTPKVHRKSLNTLLSKQKNDFPKANCLTQKGAAEHNECIIESQRFVIFAKMRGDISRRVPKTIDAPKAEVNARASKSHDPSAILFDDFRPEKWPTRTNSGVGFGEKSAE